MSTNYQELFDRQVQGLKDDPNVDRVYTGKIVAPVTVFKVYDRSESGVDSLELDEGDDVFVTFDHDGSWFINFSSFTPGSYLYRAAGTGALADSDIVHIDLPLKEL